MTLPKSHDHEQSWNLPHRSPMKGSVLWHFRMFLSVVFQGLHCWEILFSQDFGGIHSSKLYTVKEIKDTFWALGQRPSGYGEGSHKKFPAVLRWNNRVTRNLKHFIFILMDTSVIGFRCATMRTPSFFFFFFFCLFCLFRATPVAYGGSQAGGLIGAYTTATAMPDPSRLCDLHHSSWQCWILDPLSKARGLNLQPHGS